MDDDSLSLTPTRDLLQELHKRFDALVCVATAARTKEEDGLILSLHGSFHACLGLIETAKISVAHAGVDNDADGTG